MALQGEYSESLSLSLEAIEVNEARRSHAGPRKNLRDSRLRLPPHGQGRYLSAIGLPSSRLRGGLHIKATCEPVIHPPPHGKNDVSLLAALLVSSVSSVYSVVHSSAREQSLSAQIPPVSKHQDMQQVMNEMREAKCILRSGNESPAVRS